MNRILVATDFSERSQRAVERALAIARHTQAKPILTHVVDVDEPEALRASYRALAEDVLAQECSRHPDLDCQPLVISGDVFWAVREAAVELEVDLIIAGEHRRSGLRDMFRDTTIERLVRVAPVPVLIVRSAGGTPYDEAVVAIEADESSVLADAVARLGDAGPQKIAIVHAFDAIAAGMMANAGISRTEINAYRQETAVAARRSIELSLPPAWRKAPIRVIEGGPTQVIETTIESVQAALLVVATHARRGLARFILGSVASFFIRQGTTDTLVVPIRQWRGPTSNLGSPQATA